LVLQGHERTYGLVCDVLVNRTATAPPLLGRRSAHKVKIQVSNNVTEQRGTSSMSRDQAGSLARRIWIKWR
jgi:hypothetical protein